jgi:hypothetical protein
MRDTTKWLVAAAAAVGAVVVAGLQLSKIPHGGVASTLAIGGFIVALGGVAFILFSAAGVLSAGYTTLGELVSLKRVDDYTEQQRQERDWGKVIARWEEKVIRFERKPKEPDAIYKRRSPVEVIKSIGAQVIFAALTRISQARIHIAESEGIRIDDMLNYLDIETRFFSNGLARSLPELWERIDITDKEILSLRAGQSAEADSARVPRRTYGRIGKMRTGSPRRQPATEPKPVDVLEWPEWRQSHLEAAAGQLIAFANQKLMEHKFTRLKRAVRIGGIAVAVGVGSFVLAPNFSTGTPLAITQPTPVSIRIISDKFAAGCPSGMLLQGVAVGGTWEKPIVATEAQGSCGARQVTLDSRQAIAVPRVSESPSQTPS